jgi:hypothetical protein
MIGGALLAFSLMAACSSSDDDGDNTATGGGSSTGGAKSTGGSSSAGGAKATGGATASAGGNSALYECDAVPKRDPGGSGKENDKCCSTSIGDVGTCVKESGIADKTLAGAYGHDSCSATDGLKCAPADGALADAGANGVFDTCSTKIGGGDALEGRCLPKCFVAGNGAAANLKKETCKTDDLVCAPCYNPIDGKSTGACTQNAGDKPTDAAPTPYKKCGADLGICVPSALVTDPVQRTALEGAFPGEGGPASGCGADELCAPTLKANDQAACFTHCTSIAGEGACVPTYLVPVGQQSVLNATGCQVGELCAPCLNPLSVPPNQKTGACN